MGDTLYTSQMAGKKHRPINIQMWVYGSPGSGLITILMVVLINVGRKIYVKICSEL